jgi:hypothetical protein
MFFFAPDVPKNKGTLRKAISLSHESTGKKISVLLLFSASSASSARDKAFFIFMIYGILAMRLAT